MNNYFKTLILPKLHELEKLTGRVHIPVQYEDESHVIAVRVK